MRLKLQIKQVKNINKKQKQYKCKANNTKQNPTKINQPKQSKFKPKVMKPNKDETYVKVNDIKAS